MLVLGNPDLGNPQYDLDHAQEEALAIARIVPGATVLLRREARAAAIVRDGANYDAIHVAAHGVFDPGSPLDSALILAGDGGSDGWLRAKDLYRLRLNADLITLSACETALGKVTGGDDVVGFTRGFLYAGARAIVSSLWKVDDLATRDLMVDYYRGLQKSDKSEALRQAQLGVMRQHAHPFYWAAFQLTGRAQ
jgi:CHAT domain-containing protein